MLFKCFPAAPAVSCKTRGSGVSIVALSFVSTGPKFGAQGRLGVVAR